MSHSGASKLHELTFPFCFIQSELHLCFLELQDSWLVPYEFFQAVYCRNHIKTKTADYFQKGSISTIQTLHLLYVKFIMQKNNALFFGIIGSSCRSLLIKSLFSLIEAPEAHRFVKKSMGIVMALLFLIRLIIWAVCLFKS